MIFNYYLILDPRQKDPKKAVFSLQLFLDQTQTVNRAAIYANVAHVEFGKHVTSHI